MGAEQDLALTALIRAQQKNGRKPTTNASHSATVPQLDRRKQQAIALVIMSTGTTKPALDSGGVQQQTGAGLPRETRDGSSSYFSIGVWRGWPNPSDEASTQLTSRPRSLACRAFATGRYRYSSSTPVRDHKTTARARNGLIALYQKLYAAHTNDCRSSFKSTPFSSRPSCPEPSNWTVRGCVLLCPEANPLYGRAKKYKEVGCLGRGRHQARYGRWETSPPHGRCHHADPTQGLGDSDDRALVRIVDGQQRKYKRG